MNLTAEQIKDRIEQAIDRRDTAAVSALRSPYLASVKEEDADRSRGAIAISKVLAQGPGDRISVHYHPRDVRYHPKLTTVGGWYEVRRHEGPTSHYGFERLTCLGAIYLDGDGSAYIASPKGSKRDIRCLTLTDAARAVREEEPS